MKMKKKYLFPAVLACAFVLLQSSFSLAGAKKDVDEELSPYKWGHWDRMVPPAAGPVALAPTPVSAALPSPDPVVPPDPPTPELKPPMYPPEGGGGMDIGPDLHQAQVNLHDTGGGRYASIPN